MFKTILHANDGSDHAFKALSFAIDIAKQNKAELHMVSIEEIPSMPEYIEEVREEKGTAARRYHAVVQRANAMAQERHVKLQTHILAGHPVRDIIELAVELKADLLVIKGDPCIYNKHMIFPKPGVDLSNPDNFASIGMTITGLPALNAIRSVVAAPPGLITSADLSLRGFAGRFNLS